MATYPTRAIIIGRHNFGEADRVLIMLTPERGVIRGVAKGVRKIKSRLAGHLELFSESELMLAEGRNLDIITSARLATHLAMGDDYDRMRLAYLFAEMVNRLGADAEHHDGLYDLLRDAYQGLAAGAPDAVLELWFKLRLLDRLGYRPDLGSCQVCHSPTSADRQYAFSPELGGVVDASCHAPGSLPLTQDQIKLWRLIQQRPLATIRGINGVGEMAARTMLVCDAFYDYTFGKRFRSAQVLT